MSLLDDEEVLVNDTINKDFLEGLGFEHSEGFHYTKYDIYSLYFRSRLVTLRHVIMCTLNVIIQNDGFDNVIKVDLDKCKLDFKITLLPGSHMIWDKVKKYVDTHDVTSKTEINYIINELKKIFEIYDEFEYPF